MLLRLLGRCMTVSCIEYAARKADVVIFWAILRWYPAPVHWYPNAHGRDFHPPSAMMSESATPLFLYVDAPPILRE